MLHWCIARQTENGLVVFEQSLNLRAQVSESVSQQAQEVGGVRHNNDNTTISGLKPDAEVSAGSRSLAHKVRISPLKQRLLAAAKMNSMHNQPHHEQQLHCYCPFQILKEATYQFGIGCLSMHCLSFRCKSM